MTTDTLAKADITLSAVRRAAASTPSRRGKAGR